jgi:4-hydroxy-tetrahydrodipicolinate reductase
MGQAVIREINRHPGARLASALVAPGNANDGKKVDSITYGSDVKAALQNCDALIDFSHPKAAIDAALMMFETPCRVFVSGTTGYSVTEEKALEAASRSVVLVKSGNFSVGICVLENLVEHASRMLSAEWDIDVLDIHHRHKKDAPSGTALMLGAAAQKGRAKSPSRLQKMSRPQKTTVDYASLRHGGIVGEHHVSIASEMETLTLSHCALDRAVFARGALVAALWAAGKPRKPGLYSLHDVLGL